MSLHLFKQGSLAASVILLTACGGGGGGGGSSNGNDDRSSDDGFNSAQVVVLTKTNSKPLSISSGDLIAVASTPMAIGADVGRPQIKRAILPPQSPVQSVVKHSLNRVVRAQTETENCESGKVKYTTQSDTKGYVTYLSCVDSGVEINGRMNVDITNPDHQVVEYVDFSVRALDGSANKTINGSSVSSYTSVSSSIKIEDKLENYVLRTDNYVLNKTDSANLAQPLPGTGTFYDSRYGKFELHDSRIFGQNNDSLGVNYANGYADYSGNEKLLLALDENGDGEDDAFAILYEDQLDAESNHLPPVASISNQSFTTLINVNQAITLNGLITTTEPDGDFLYFNWSMTPSEGATIDKPKSPLVNFTATSANSYTITLEVTDGEFTRSATLDVQVLAN